MENTTYIKVCVCAREQTYTYYGQKLTRTSGSMLIYDSLLGVYSYFFRLLCSMGEKQNGITILL